MDDEPAIILPDIGHDANGDNDDPGPPQPRVRNRPARFFGAGVGPRDWREMDFDFDEPAPIADNNDDPAPPPPRRPRRLLRGARRPNNPPEPAVAPRQNPPPPPLERVNLDSDSSDTEVDEPPPQRVRPNGGPPIAAVRPDGQPFFVRGLPRAARRAVPLGMPERAAARRHPFHFARAPRHPCDESLEALQRRIRTVQEKGTLLNYLFSHHSEGPLFTSRGTPLHVACLDSDGERGEAKIALLIQTANQAGLSLQLLASARSEGSGVSNGGHTPLHRLLVNSSTTTRSMEMICAAWPGAILAKTNVYNSTPLCDASFGCLLSTLDGLQAKLDIMLNIARQMPGGVEELITHRGHEGSTALHDAVVSPRWSAPENIASRNAIFATLLQACPTVIHIIDDEGRNPIHRCLARITNPRATDANRSQLDLVRALVTNTTKTCLIAALATETYAEDFDKTYDKIPIDLVRSLGFTDVEEYFAGLARIQEPENDWTLLHYAAANTIHVGDRPPRPARRRTRVFVNGRPIGNPAGLADVLGAAPRGGEGRNPFAELGRLVRAQNERMEEARQRLAANRERLAAVRRENQGGAAGANQPVRLNPAFPDPVGILGHVAILGNNNDIGPGQPAGEERPPAGGPRNRMRAADLDQRRPQRERVERVRVRVRVRRRAPEDGQEVNEDDLAGRVGDAVADGLRAARQARLAAREARRVVREQRQEERRLRQVERRRQQEEHADPVEGPLGLAQLLQQQQQALQQARERERANRGGVHLVGVRRRRDDAPDEDERLARERRHLEMNRQRREIERIREQARRRLQRRGLAGQVGGAQEDGLPQDQQARREGRRIAVAHALGRARRMQAGDPVEVRRVPFEEAMEREANRFRELMGQFHRQNPEAERGEQGQANGPQEQEDGAPVEPEKRLGTKKLVDWLLEVHPEAASMPDSSGRLPIHLAVESGKEWENGVQSLAGGFPGGVSIVDPACGLFPFMSAATGTQSNLDTIFELLRFAPHNIGVPSDVARA